MERIVVYNMLIINWNNWNNWNALPQFEFSYNAF